MKDLRTELLSFLNSLDGDDLRNLADGNLSEEEAVDNYLKANMPTDGIIEYNGAKYRVVPSAGLRGIDVDELTNGFPDCFLGHWFELVEETNQND